MEVRSDNLTTVAYINHQGGREPELTALVRPLWEWAFKTGTTVFATYIPGKKNDRADKLSRRQRDRTDWMLNRALFCSRNNTHVLAAQRWSQATEVKHNVYYTSFVV